MEFVLEQKVKVLIGDGKLDQIGVLLKEAGYSRAFLVYDSGVKAAGIIERVFTYLDRQQVYYTAFDKVEPDPPANIIDEGAELCRKEHCDCVVAIGGGSAIDTAKGITVLRFNDGKILDYREKEIKPAAGLITIPTTAGTGSELSQGIIITDPSKKEKVPLLAFQAMSEYAILDPELTQTMPRKLTITTGLDVFSHAAEAYTTLLSNPASDLICEKLMETVFQWLPAAASDGQDSEARRKMLICASLGGWMLYNASAHVGHSIAHVIGAELRIAHGAACAYAFPAMIKEAACVLPEKVRKIGQILGAPLEENLTPNQIGERTAKAYMVFRDQILGLEPQQMPSLQADHVETMANAIANEPFAQIAPFKVTEAKAKKMLMEILVRQGGIA
ncbi:MAG: iron-containing alcohol dehydrogenase [Clostridiales Family XIII bacterium]|nr:iron-containing alcohol dehydrogenase [Clostridia bacterium]MDY3010561.1 iron-containing alcohol dehydrogenase [Clostridiales Family XIII bacterium]